MTRWEAGVLLLLAVSALCTGCDWLKKKDSFTGIIKNGKDLRVYTWDPGNTGAIVQLDPNEHFSATLKGSERYHFKAWLNDGTVISDFRARINQVADDASVDDIDCDWAWVIGGRFHSAVSPGPGLGPAVGLIVDLESRGGPGGVPEVKASRDVRGEVGVRGR